MGGRELPGAFAHNISDTSRTIDVLLSEDTSFADLMLSAKTLHGLGSNGFARPSPIQLQSIPIGRLGTDLIVHAKSGTGKTLVFTIIALEMLDLSIPQLQVLVLAPTREIAVQIKEVMTSISSGYSGLKIASFIGGLSRNGDKEQAKLCHVAVGTPGRVKDLVESGTLSTGSVRLFVLDEADRLVEMMKNDVNYIFGRLPDSKQTLVVSATFPSNLDAFLQRFLVNPRRISPSSDILLIGLRHYIAVIPTHTNIVVNVRNKTSRLVNVLSTRPFRQCLIFCNMVSRMEGIATDLAKKGWPVLYLSGSMAQQQRLQTLSSLQRQRCRVLLTTDLVARGIDAEQVDLVINLDVPYDTPTFLHRVGRAGRYGAPGTSVTIVNDSKELSSVRAIFYEIGGAGFKVPLLPAKITSEAWKSDAVLDFVESTEGPDQKTPLDSCQNENITNQSKRKKEEPPMDISGVLSKSIMRTVESKPMPSYKELEQSYQNFSNEGSTSELLFRSEENNVELESAMKSLCISENCENRYDASLNGECNGIVKEEYESSASSESIYEEEDDSCLNNFVPDDSDLTTEDESCSTDERSTKEYSTDEQSTEECSADEQSTEDSTECSDSESTDSDDQIDERSCCIDNSKKCNTCNSWFRVWQEELRMQRNKLQQQIYLQEMSK